MTAGGEAVGVKGERSQPQAQRSGKAFFGEGTCELRPDW